MNTFLLLYALNVVVLIGFVVWNSMGETGE
jgi:hypothetical protein